MSFIFSRALVEACSQGKCSDTDASALLSGNPTPPLFLPNDKTMAFSRLSRFGMTFKPLTESLGAELLTSWLAGFPAKTSASPEKAQASQEPAAECGATWRASLAKYDPDSCSWRTVQLSLLEDLELSSVTWPRSGMTADGQCWELPMLEPIINVTGSGLWPTPTVCGNYNRKGASATSGDGLATAVRQWPTPNASKISNDMNATMSGDGRQTPNKLGWAVAWATPVARDYRSPGRSRLERTGSKSGDPLPQQVGGALNPTWVEWLMGWPLGWTDLKPSATGKSHFAPPRLSECLPQSFEAETA